MALKIHRLPTEVEESESTDGRSTLPVMPHCSQVKLTSACNCGRKQASREDPFDAKVRLCVSSYRFEIFIFTKMTRWWRTFYSLQAANFDFYDQLTRSCCNQLEEFKFPIFQPSTSDFKAAKIEVSQWISASTNSKKDVSSFIREDRELSVAPAMSLGLSLGERTIIIRWGFFFLFRQVLLNKIMIVFCNVRSVFRHEWWN